MWIHAFLPKILPNGWYRVRLGEDGAMYANRHTHQTLILSGDTEQDGKRWLHVSTAFPDRLPTWEELVWVKEWIIGTDKKAVQILPPRSQYVNLHPHVLHLWHCVDTDPLPDFTRGTGRL